MSNTLVIKKNPVCQSKTDTSDKKKHGANRAVENVTQTQYDYTT